MSARDLGEARPQLLAEWGRDRLDALCRAVSLPGAEQRSAQAVFQLLGASWGKLSTDEAPWENDLTDDGTPCEFSLGFEAGKPEVRMLVESQLDTERPSQHTSWRAGTALQAVLRARGLCDSSQFERVAPLFVPPADCSPRFSLWHAAALREGKWLFKAYVNPEVTGIALARSLVAETLSRLGLADAWAFLERRLARDTRLPYLSVDLNAARDARVKIYLSANDATSVERLIDGCSNVVPGDALRWLNDLTHSHGPYSGRPILTCHAFRHGATACETTVHVPIREYAPNDEEALRRTLALLPPANGKQLELAMKALARTSLRLSRGVLTYVSLRVVAGGVRVTTYLAPGAYVTNNGARGSGTIESGRPSPLA